MHRCSQIFPHVSEELCHGERFFDGCTGHEQRGEFGDVRWNFSRDKKDWQLEFLRSNSFQEIQAR